MRAEPQPRRCEPDTASENTWPRARMISGVGGPGLQVETSGPWVDGGEGNLALPVTHAHPALAASCLRASLMEAKPARVCLPFNW